MATSSGLPTASLPFLINHIVLPPKPISTDADAAIHTQALLEVAVQALHDLQRLQRDGPHQTIILALTALETLRSVRNEDGSLNESKLLISLQKMVEDDEDSMIPLEVQAQNAGIIIRRQSDHVNFACFELLPSNEAVINCKGRLQRQFPGLVSELPIATMKRKGLMSTLAATLAKLSVQCEPSPQMTRNDTAHPGLVTDFFVNVLAALGKPTDSTRIMKNTREEVHWRSGGAPWRRSPLWLTIRVAVQLLFRSEATKTVVSDRMYKAFTVLVLARLLEASKEALEILNNDALHSIVAKALYRLHKFHEKGPCELLQDDWNSRTQELIRDVHGIMKDAWNSIIENVENHTRLPELPIVDSSVDLDISLPNVDAYLANIASATVDKAASEFQPTSVYPSYAAHTIPTNIGGADDENQIYILAAVEQWVELHLESWAANHKDNPNSCGKLLRLMQSYYGCAESAYTKNPQCSSIMYLTLCSIWVQCDMIACIACPLLTKYDPRVCLDELIHLSLPLRVQLERLAKIESYVQIRQESAAKDRPSVFQDFGGASSFAVKFFEQSDEHKTLLAEIERRRAKSHREKCAELENVKTRYSQLLTQINNSECEYQTTHIGGPDPRQVTLHSNSCSKCALRAQMNALDISIYESPLSSDPNIARATIFELQVPMVFGDWRDATRYLLHDVLGIQVPSLKKPAYTIGLENHNVLSPMLSGQDQGRRIRIVSGRKPHTDSTKGNKPIPVLTERDVCLESALIFNYFDNTLGAWAYGAPVSSETVRNRCMYSLPTQACALERYMYRPISKPDGLPSNECISHQADCPIHLSGDEFKSLAVVPLGQNTIYGNILVNLAMPQVDFAKHETQILMQQIVLEAGLPNSTVERNTHGMLRDALFCGAILTQLELSLARMTENWEKWRALSTFTLLVRRILNLNSTENVQRRGLVYLGTMRKVCVKWLHSLESRVADCTDYKQKNGLNEHILHISLLGCSTFDIEGTAIQDILRQPGAVSELLQCAIRVQENMLSHGSNVRNPSNVMYRHFQHMMYRILPILRNQILLDGEELKVAILATWPTFQPSENVWISMPSPHDQWIENKSNTLLMSFNLLTGALLVNGKPLARLPTKYTKHPLFEQLFQNCTLEVGPSTMSDMEFCTRATRNGYAVHFAMRGDDLRVVATNNTCRLDVIPSGLLKDHLPYEFAEKYVHWYDHHNKQILFRPKDRIFEEIEDGWHLQPVSSTWRLVRGLVTAVNMSSKSALTLLRIFQPLEDREHVHIAYSGESRSTEISLPRLQLDFFIAPNEDKIRSRQYRTMMIDQHQGLGTLVGLYGKLVLRNTENMGERMFLIALPRHLETDSIQYKYASSSTGHVSVTIKPQEKRRLHTYSLEPELGRIIDSGNMQDKLLLAYLHALTSYHLPDRFTRYTGTESALMILKSASTKSFATLSPENISLLTLIAKLAPNRTLHSDYIQEIHWDSNIPVFSQHTAFHQSAKDIFDIAQAIGFFHPGSDFEMPRGFPKIKHDLQARSCIRNATFLLDEFGAELFSGKMDVEYVPRSTHVDSRRGQRAYQVAAMILQDRFALIEPIGSLRDNLFKNYLGSSTMKAAKQSFCLDELSFDVKWLGDSVTILADWFCSFHKHLPSCSRRLNEFDIILWISTMAYSTTAHMEAIQALAAFYKVGVIPGICVPMGSAKTYNLPSGTEFIARAIEETAVLHYKGINECPESQMTKEEHETRRSHQRRINAALKRSQKKACVKFLTELRRQWPRQIALIPRGISIQTYIDVSSAMIEVKRLFRSWWDNVQFYKYIDQISEALARHPVTPTPIPTFPISTQIGGCAWSDVGYYLSSRSVFMQPAPSIPGISLLVHQDDEGLLEYAAEPPILLSEQPTNPNRAAKHNALIFLCNSLGFMARSKSELDYVKALRTSCKALKSFEKENKIFFADISTTTLAILEDYLHKCRGYLQTLNDRLTATAKGGAASSRALAFDVQYAPRLTPTFWLRNLHATKFENLTQPWKAAVIEYAIAITRLHRAKRMVAVHDKPKELAQELQHAGHMNWDPFEFPETLLLEAESGILVRPIQETIAQQMRSPPEYASSCVQMNMGEGKSSVIVPMVAASLSDTQRLVRVVVAKPQSKQMLQILSTRLGGLLNRRIYHLPFQRDLRLSVQEAQEIHKICREARENRGIILVQPEQILSFKLMGIEALMENDNELSQRLLETQALFDSSSFDIVDEADENFNPKFELVYTMGSQEVLDFAPQRWLIIQEVLSLVAKYAPEVNDAIPGSIDIDDDVQGVFPRMKISNEAAIYHLFRLIAQHIATHGLPGLAVRAGLAGNGQAIIEEYISKSVLSLEQIAAVENNAIFNEYTKNAIWLVRGLLACGILRFCLTTKRWRVDFGLDPNRGSGSLLAVPYRFKDGPSPRSEFSHPDVLIILTLLSYYYGGLTDGQMFMAFDHVLKSDQAAIYFNEWIRSATSGLPVACRNLGGINIKDRQYCIQNVFPYLRYSKACIDYFLSRLVFPKELRHFTSKISASGWDMAAVKGHPITGFSGTKDCACLLPLTMRHLDLLSQEHVNALVLDALLETSQVEMLPARTNGTDAENVLTATIRLEPEVRVLLDCGAAILELNNRQVAAAWLRLSDPKRVSAAVYFDDEELSVLDRTGRVEPFQISPFAKQLDSCVVYLDEAHTRGIDLKLPLHYRACLTLGQALTKDKLLQGAMRMRQLGKGQAVIFLVPPEIATKIFELTAKDPEDGVEVQDVLLWSMDETWRHIKKCIPLWAVQGERYLSKQHLYRGVDTTREQAQGFLEDELQSLEFRYRPGLDGNRLTARAKTWDKSNEDIKKIIQRAEGFGAMNLSSGDLEEEQERELAPEKEEQREVEHLVKLEAAKHSVHKHLDHLVIHGTIRPGSPAFHPAFKALEKTSAAQSFDITKFPKDLLVTSDFARTVQFPTGAAKTNADIYQRNVQWVLSVPDVTNSKSIKNLVVLSPHEANILMPRIRESDKVTLHMFAPRTNASYAPLDHLNLFCVGRDFSPISVPRSLTLLLNLFAGTLYLGSYGEYCELCKFLGLLHTKPQPGQTISADGFITPPSGTWGFVESPVPFLRTLLMKIRREGDGVEKTHMGKILSGVVLEEADFQEDVEMSGT